MIGKVAFIESKNSNFGFLTFYRLFTIEQYVSVFAKKTYYF